MPLHKLSSGDLQNALFPAERVQSVRMRSVDFAPQKIPRHEVRLDILRANGCNLAFALALGQFGGKNRIGYHIDEHRKRVPEIGGERTHASTQSIVARFNGKHAPYFLDLLRNSFGRSGVGALEHRLRKKPVNTIALERFEQRPALENDRAINHRQSPVGNQYRFGAVAQAMKFRFRTARRDRGRASGTGLRSQHCDCEIGIRQVATNNALDIRCTDRLYPLKVVPAEGEVPRVQPIQTEVRRHALNGLKLFNRINRKYALRLLDFLLPYLTFTAVVNTADDSI